MVLPVSVLAATTEPMQSLAHGIMIGGGFIGPTIGIGLVGANYLAAVGRNPEAAKFLGQALVFVGLIEVYGLLAFAATFFVK
jgi:F0F1-type ATP synthase membrane subunit c/vacuolar-type H+-ATPase subunit K